MNVLSSKLRGLEGGRIGFWCPGCDGMHHIKVRDDGQNISPAWGYNGDPEKPTFTPSVLVRSGHFADGTDPNECCLCKRALERGKASLCGVCHSFVTDGRIQFLGDCTHDLAGQTVDLPDFDEVEQ